MALALERAARIPFIFDIRGLMAEEYVDAGRWATDGLAFRITKVVERAAIRRATANVVLTERVKQMLFGQGTSDRVSVIPCCADIDRIAAQRSGRERVREALGLADSLVLIYVGKFTGWYMEAEMVDFFAEARIREPRAHFHVLTQHDREPIVKQFERAGLARDTYSIARVPPELVGEHLSAADAAISFIRRCPSKISSSPTKIGEYLAAGLPIITSAGIGDVDELVGRDGVGILIDTFDQDAYVRAAERLWTMAADRSTAEKCMRIAEERLSLRRVGIPAYEALYSAVAAEVTQSAG
jgi:glycosyltransferase involved in cell wall biosynthesis